MTVINAIAAICRGRGLGNEGHIPWYDPIDLARFKLFTKGNIVIMGSGTWKSLGQYNRPLKSRDNFIITSNAEEVLGEAASWDFNAGYSVQVFDCSFCAIDKAIDKANEDNQTIWAIGGQSIYEQFLPFSQYLHLTIIDRHYEFDRVFPEYENKFRLIQCEPHPEDQDVTFNTYERISS